MTQHKVTFYKDGDPLEIVYWFDGRNVVMGEAYFRKDDMLADVVDGMFTHPWTGTQFQLTVPSHFFGTAGKECTLDVLKYVNVGRAKASVIPVSNHFV